MPAKLKILYWFILLFACAVSSAAQTTAFSYQGRFTDSTVAQPTNGSYTMKFRLYDAASDGNQTGTEQTAVVSVVNGTFTISLDFGAAPFADGQTRWLEIQVGTTTLAPRQQIAGVPYAVRAASSNTADMLSESCSSCVTSSQIASLDGTKVSGAVSDATNAVTATTAANVAAGSGDSVVGAINNAATTGAISSSRLSSDVVLINPNAAQTPTGVIQGNTPMLNLTGSYSACSNTYQSSFKLNADGGLLSAGNYDGGCSGFVPTEGGGTRLMWYPGKAAFRAGYIDGTQWDDANIGNYSAAFGFNARSSGDYSFSAGERSVAAQFWSLAIGRYNTASGASSVALGEGAHTNVRQGSFVFADRSYSGNICDTSTLGSPYGLNNSGCAATGGVDTLLRAPVNNSFTVRASGGTSFYTNAASTTGLRFSTFSSSNAMYGSFVWTDRSSDVSLSPTAQNQTIFRSSGGFTIYTDAGLNAGVIVSPGSGAWSSVSDRNMKENFAAVDPHSILQKVLNLPISTWNYKTQNASIRHIGAMAQDFYKLFGVGEDEKRIATIDPDGVAFAAIQGLNEKIEERTENLKKENAELKEQIKRQQTMIDALKKLVCANNAAADICRQ